jgi:hypothetical protein
MSKKDEPFAVKLERIHKNLMEAIHERIVLRDAETVGLLHLALQDINRLRDLEGGK